MSACSTQPRVRPGAASVLCPSSLAATPSAAPLSRAGDTQGHHQQEEPDWMQITKRAEPAWTMTEPGCEGSGAC